MKHPWIVTTLFSLAALLISPLQAASDGPSAEQRVEWDSRLEQAAMRQAEAEQLKKKSDDDYAFAREACLKKFLVNACREDARQLYLAAQRQARTMNSEARAQIREVKKAQFAARQLPLSAESSAVSAQSR